MSERPRIDGRRFGWLLLGGLTGLWALGLFLWLESLFTADTLHHRLSRLLPGLLPTVGYTLTFTLMVIWGGLIWESRRRRHQTIPALSKAELLELDPGRFERYVALIFRHKGYQVRHRGKSGDHGVDLEVLTPGGQLGIVQCKRYRATVGEEVVRDLYGTMLHEGAAHAFLVTAAEISASARDWAAGKPITLVDGDRVLELVGRLGR